MSKSKGFTLIELMIAVAIVGILLAVALPNYRTFVLKSHRTEAINGLLDAASRQARFYTINNTYADNMNALGYTSNTGTNSNPVPSATNTYYIVSIASTASATASAPATFTLSADPAGTQQANDTCGRYTFTDAGVKSAGNGTAAVIATCWGN